MDKPSLTKFALALMAALALSACGHSSHHSSSGADDANQEQPGDNQQPGGGDDEQPGGGDYEQPGGDNGNGNSGTTTSVVKFTCEKGMDSSNLFASYTGDYGDNGVDPNTPDYAHTVTLDLDSMTFKVDGGAAVVLTEDEGTELMEGIVAAMDEDLLVIDLSEAEGSIQFSLSGASTRAIDITAAQNASVGLELNSVSVTSGNYPAIAIGPKTATVYVTLKGDNYLADSREFGTGYSEANGTDYMMPTHWRRTSQMMRRRPSSGPRDLTPTASCPPTASCASPAKAP